MFQVILEHEVLTTVPEGEMKGVLFSLHGCLQLTIEWGFPSETCPECHGKATRHPYPALLSCAASRSHGNDVLCRGLQTKLVNVHMALQRRDKDGHDAMCCCGGGVEQITCATGCKTEVLQAGSCLTACAWQQIEAF